MLSGAVPQLTDRFDLGVNLDLSVPYLTGVGLRLSWLSLSHRAIICYCEDDVSISVAPDEEAFEKERIYCRRFYGKPRYLDRDFVSLEDRHAGPEGR